jgi:hypothetical protein
MALLLAIVMLGIGAVVLGRVLILRRPPLTGRIPFDVAFAAFFILRGLMHIRSWKRMEAAAAALESEPPRP